MWDAEWARCRPWQLFLDSGDGSRRRVWELYRDAVQRQYRLHRHVTPGAEASAAADPGLSNHSVLISGGETVLQLNAKALLLEGLERVRAAQSAGAQALSSLVEQLVPLRQSWAAAMQAVADRGSASELQHALNALDAGLAATDIAAVTATLDAMLLCTSGAMVPAQQDHCDLVAPSEQVCVQTSREVRLPERTTGSSPLRRPCRVQESPATVVCGALLGDDQVRDLWHTTICADEDPFVLAAHDSDRTAVVDLMLKTRSLLAPASAMARYDFKGATFRRALMACIPGSKRHFGPEHSQGIVRRVHFCSKGPYSSMVQHTRPSTLDALIPGPSGPNADLLRRSLSVLTFAEAVQEASDANGGDMPEALQYVDDAVSFCELPAELQPPVEGLGPLDHKVLNLKRRGIDSLAWLRHKPLVSYETSVEALVSGVGLLKRRSADGWRADVCTLKLVAWFLAIYDICSKIAECEDELRWSSDKLALPSPRAAAPQPGNKRRR